MKRTMRRNPERPIDWLGLDGLTDEQRTKIQDQWVEYAKSGNKDLERANLGNGNLRGADLGGADLGGADLIGANLRGANLGGANLSGANLRGANLIDANLSGAKLERASLWYADLRGANLRGANLISANLINAYLEGTDLRGADLRGADLTRARGADLTRANLSGVILPNYFKLLRTVGLTDLSEIKVESSDSDRFFELRKFFRDRGQDEFGELLELEIRAEMDQVKRELGLE
jgi:hypothetical protein